MNDDKLSRELGRRASSVSLDHDWAQRELLPAVNHAIRSRPQRVASSRLPGLVGLSAVVAILLVLVVALPRSAPAPGSTEGPTRSISAVTATQSLDALRILSAQEFATAVRQSHLRSATVLVDGEIGTDVAPATLCRPTESCLMGRLQEIDPSVDVFSSWTAAPESPETTTVVNAGDSWPFWYRPQAPVVGTLVLSVDADGGVEFVGRPRLPEPDDGVQSVVWSAAEAVQLDIESFELQEVVLVDAWLGGVPTHPCPSMFEQDMLAGLPADGCQDAWLGDDPSGSLGNGILVQDSAYHTFAAIPNSATIDPSRLQPERGLFAVAKRLYGGGCAAEPPCWQWEIVGRLDLPNELPVRSPFPSGIPGLRTVFECDVGGVSLSLIDATRLVTGCTGLFVDRHNPTGATNPNGDLKTIRLLWGTSTCIRRGTFELTRVVDRYELTVREPGDEPGCVPLPEAHAVDFYVSESIPAASISVRVIRDGQQVFPLASQPVVATTFDCVGLEGQTTLVDRTGLVTECRDLGIDPNALTNGILNPDGDSRQLHLDWGQGICVEEGAALEFSQAEGRYTIFIREQWSRTIDCAFPGTRAFEFTLSKELPASMVDVETSPSAAARTFDCVGSAPDLGNGAVRIEDHSGLIQGCEAAAIDYDDLSDPTSAVDPPTITMTWAVPCATDSWRTLLQFWPQAQPDEASSSRPPYLLVTNRLEPLGDGGCHTAMSGRHVRIDLATALDWADIEQVLMEDGRDRATEGTDVGDFELMLSTAVTGYGANQPVEITAELAYQGRADALPVSGMRVHYSVAQVDGPLSLGTGPEFSMCTGSELKNGESTNYPLGANLVRVPYTGIESYYNPIPFVLPSGVYVVHVGVSLWTDGGCTGDSVLLDATIAITVE